MVARYCSLARRMASKYIAKNTLPMVPTTVPVMPPPKPPSAAATQSGSFAFRSRAKRAGRANRARSSSTGDAKPFRQRLGGQSG